MIMGCDDLGCNWEKNRAYLGTRSFMNGLVDVSKETREAIC